MNIEDIRADERYEALDKLTDQIINNVQRMVDKKGGNGELFIDYLARKEVINEVLEGLHIAMSNDYGVKTKS